MTNAETRAWGPSELTEILNEVGYATGAWAELSPYDEMRAWGAPSECAELIAGGIERRVQAILAAHGRTAEEVDAELERRCDSKTAYTLGGLIFQGHGEPEGYIG